MSANGYSITNPVILPPVHFVTTFILVINLKHLLTKLQSLSSPDK